MRIRQPQLNCPNNDGPISVDPDGTGIVECVQCGLQYHASCASVFETAGCYGGHPLVVRPVGTRPPSTIARPATIFRPPEQRPVHPALPNRNRGARFVPVLLFSIVIIAAIAFLYSQSRNSRRVVPSVSPPVQVANSPITVTATATCLGQFAPACHEDDHPWLHLGVRFEYFFANRNPTTVWIEWKKDGLILGRWSENLQYSPGAVWENYKSPTELPPGTYEAVLYSEGVERGHAQLVIDAPAIESTDERTSADEETASVSQSATSEPTAPPLPTNQPQIETTDPAAPAPAPENRNLQATPKDQGWRRFRGRPHVPQPIQINETIEKARLIVRVTPVYPPMAQRARVEGLVRLSATIGTDGNLRNIRIISGNPMLTGAALAAVQQWHYLPAKLNRTAVEEETQIDMNFTLR